MKKKFLIPVLTMSVFALVVATNTSKTDNNMFIESDNIAFASAELSGGHSCKPSAFSFCPLIGDGNAVGYKKVEPKKEISNIN